MEQYVRRRTSTQIPWGQLAIAAAMGVALGIGCLKLSPLLTLAALAGAMLLLVAVLRPELALLAILVATSSVVAEERLPLLPIGIGSLHVPDVLLLSALGLAVVRWLVERGYHPVRTPLDRPVLAFYLLAVLSTVVGAALGTVTLREGVRELRLVTYYLAFFVVTGLVQTDRQIKTLVRGLLLLASVVAAMMLVQYMLGRWVSILPGRVEELGTSTKDYADVTRILPPGQSLVLVGFVLAGAHVALRDFRPSQIIWLALAGLLGLAVLLTFNRSFWIAIIMAAGLLAVLAKDADRRRLVARGVLVAILVLLVMLPMLNRPNSGPGQLMAASLERLGTLVRGETTQESSLQLRYVEYEYAIPQLTPPSLLGLGLGARYRPWDPRVDWRGDDSSGFDGRWYIHNGHVWILLKMGLLGYLAFVWMSVAFVVRGLRYWRSIRDPHLRATLLAFVLVYPGILAGALVNPIFMQWFWIPVLGIMLGTNEAILAQSRSV